MPFSLTISRKVLLGGLALGALVIGSLWFFMAPTPQKTDALLLAAFEKIPGIWAYTQDVETEIVLSESHIHVMGTYHINGPEARFSSIATTSVTLGENEKRQRTFTVKNISIANDLYTRVETESTELRADIPYDAWHHFTKDAIPETFADIAVAGPTLDNLLLFQGNGKYLTLVENHGTDENWGETLARYTFTLSEAAHAHRGGTLETVIFRIGEGTIDVWIDPQHAEIRHLSFNNGTYHSTTTITAINNPPSIVPPEL